ncbi:hypothetical protein ES704_01158 [subsurface metagenome]|jgi:hypothetical protein
MIIKDLSNNLFPKVISIKQKFNSYKVKDINSTIAQEMLKKNVKSKIKPGMSIAVGVGSRGIENLYEIVKNVVDTIKRYGANPFIVPAMGSHGGATSEGQKEILDSYGITEESLGVPVKSSMEVVEIARYEGIVPIYFDKIAFHADGIIPINRVKIHTDWRGEVESGLLKMLAIGFGKHKGATEVHSLGMENFHKLIPEIGSIIINKVPVIFGVACIEDAYDQTAEIKVLMPEEFYIQEKDMLKRSKKIMAKINIPQIDVLVIDEIGKDISGDGLDPNIIGRFRGKQKNDVKGPNVKQVVVSRLSKRTHGNANGMGYADIITKELSDSIDFVSTYTNSITAGDLFGVKVPLIANSDKEAIGLALSIIKKSASNIELVRIKNTLRLDEIIVSEAILKEIKDKKEFFEIGGNVIEKMRFDENGRLI